MTLPKEPQDPKKASPTRIAIWVFAGGVGLYFIVSGIIGVMQNG